MAYREPRFFHDSGSWLGVILSSKGTRNYLDTFGVTPRWGSWWEWSPRPERLLSTHPMVPRIDVRAQRDGAGGSGKPSSRGDNTGHRRSSPVLASKADGKFEQLSSLTYPSPWHVSRGFIYTAPDSPNGMNAVRGKRWSVVKPMPNTSQVLDFSPSTTKTEQGGELRS